MALFEIIIELPVGLEVAALIAAARQAGYTDVEISPTKAAFLFSVLIRHPRSSYDTGRILAEELLRHLPSQAKYHSHRSSVSITEMSPDDLEAFLKEIESSHHDGDSNS